MGICTQYVDVGKIKEKKIILEVFWLNFVCCTLLLPDFLKIFLHTFLFFPVGSLGCFS